MKLVMILAAAATLSSISVSADAAQRCRDVRGRYIVCKTVRRYPIRPVNHRPMYHRAPIVKKVERCRDHRGRYIVCTIKKVYR